MAMVVTMMIVLCSCAYACMHELNLPHWHLSSSRQHIALITRTMIMVTAMPDILQLVCCMSLQHCQLKPCTCAQS